MSGVRVPPPASRSPWNRTYVLSQALENKSGCVPDVSQDRSHIDGSFPFLTCSGVSPTARHSRPTTIRQAGTGTSLTHPKGIRASSPRDANAIAMRTLSRVIGNVALRASADWPADLCSHTRANRTAPALTAALVHPPRVVRKRRRLLTTAG